MTPSPESAMEWRHRQRRYVGHRVEVTDEFSLGLSDISGIPVMSVTLATAVMH